MREKRVREKEEKRRNAKKGEGRKEIKKGLGLLAKKRRSLECFEVKKKRNRRDQNKNMKKAPFERKKKEKMRYFERGGQTNEGVEIEMKK